MPPPTNTTLLALLCTCAALAHVPAHAQVPRVPGAPGPPALGRDAHHINAPSQHAHPNRICAAGSGTRGWLQTAALAVREAMAVLTPPRPPLLEGTCRFPRAG